MLPAVLALAATGVALTALSVAARRAAAAVSAAGPPPDRTGAGTAALQDASSVLGRGLDDHLRR